MKDDGGDGEKQYNSRCIFKMEFMTEHKVRAKSIREDSKVFWHKNLSKCWCYLVVQKYWGRNGCFVLF